MIYTTYFANLKNLPNTIVPIAICGKLPDFYTGLRYKELAPKKEFFNIWKQNNDWNYYIKNYYELVLNKLDADKVVKDLFELSSNKDVALVCYEKPTDSCHRHLVADWLRENGYECNEL